MMFRKTKFQKNSLSAVIAAVFYAVLLMVFTACSLEGSLDSLRQKATDSCSHVWGDFKQTTAPTCTEKGEDTRYCQLNNSHKEIRDVNPLGHIWGLWKDSTATCTESGYETRNCTRDSSHSQKQEVAALGHNFSVLVDTTATCTFGGYETKRCKRCTETKTNYVDAYGHDWGQWVVTVQATATSTGIEKRTCNRFGCGYFETRTIPKISS